MSIVLDGKCHEVKERCEGGFIRTEEKTPVMLRVSHFYPKFPSGLKKGPLYLLTFILFSLPSFLPTDRAPYQPIFLSPLGSQGIVGRHYLLSLSKECPVYPRTLPLDLQL